MSKKVQRACEIARRDGYAYIWIDSCCIDKASSSELSEAINSMWTWYHCAQVCYAFLPDVPSVEDVRAEDSRFRNSLWFKRGWTLQELIAPLVVVFLSQDWEGLGTKHGLADVIYEITSIDHRILTHEKALSDESVAERMRWASGRQTTRVEDQAYSLLGIFEIKMPTLYGEGEYAFRRLQEAILLRIPDQSLFAWGSRCMPLPLRRFSFIVECASPQTPFAPSPHSFASPSKTIRVTRESIASLELPGEEYAHTPHGIRTRLCLLPLHALNPDLELLTTGDSSDIASWYLVVFRSQHAGDPRRLLSRLCYLRRDNLADVEFLHVPNLIAVSGQPLSATSNTIIFTLLLDDIERIRRTQLQTKDVFLSHPKPSTAERQLTGENSTLSLTVPMWVQTALGMRGYTISNVQGSTEINPNSFSFTLVHASSNIHIHYRHMVTASTDCDDIAVMIEARVWILSPGEEATTARCSPPYTSTTWADRGRWAMTLPARNFDLVANSGGRVTLWLGLDLTAPSRYNIRVEVTPTSTALGTAASFRPDLKNLPRVLYAPHESFNLILSGSVRRALGMKGYSAHLDLGPNEGGFRSYSLTLSSSIDPGRSIIVKYLHTLHNEAVVVVARITLESLTSDVPLETVQDGPHVVIWNDRLPWRWNLEEKHVTLALAPTGNSLTLQLGFDFAWQSEYYLHVDIEPGGAATSQPPEPPSNGHHGESPDALYWAHKSMSLTLPGHVRGSLQAQGYQVRFEELDEGGETGDPIRYLLTLSHTVHPGVTTSIEYSYRLITRYPEPDSGLSMLWHELAYPFLLAEPQSDSALSTPIAKTPFKRCEQELTFQASVQTSPPRNIQGDTPSQGAVQGDIMTTRVDWDANHEIWHGWRRHLPKKVITLTLPTGDQFILSLGFYLVWFSEYCLTVEITPRVALPNAPSRVDVPTVCDYELDDTSTEHIRKGGSVARSIGGQSLRARSDSFPLAQPPTLESFPARSRGRWKLWKKFKFRSFGG